MKKPLVYKIYYLDEEVTVVTKSTMDGDYIVVDKDTFTQVAFSPSAYKIVDNKLIKKPVEQTNGKKQKRFTLQEHDKFPGWVVEKYNLYEPIEYAIEKPQWYDNKKHSVVNKYD
tara:strand:+ start:1906 stop:2247 length:342 start_codon:yes stop_codon:yes gene_type:complete